MASTTMASASAPLQLINNVSGPRQDLAIIAQAFAYHRMLATAGLDGGLNDEDSFFGDPSGMKSDHNRSYTPGNVENQQPNPNDTAAPVFTIRFHDRLLKAPDYRSFNDERKCTNAALRPGLWVTEPNLGLSNHDMGFLSQLAQICVHSHIKDCRREECLATRQAMDNIAPPCNWTAFREWALVAMSCQASMSDSEKQSPAHTHIATVVSGLCKILKYCREHSSLLDTRSSPFRPFLDGDSGTNSRASIHLAQVSNLIYWMIKIQSQIGVGPAQFGRWNHQFLPSEVTLPWIERAVRDMEDLGLCKNRLWNLVSVSDRKQSDLPDIISALKKMRSGRSPRQESHDFLGQKSHGFCTPSKCQWAHLNSTSVTQLHKCGKDECTQKEFPVEVLETALEMGNSTAWLCKEAKLSGSQDPYIAISHVWSDGTGVGVKDEGTVNSCLFDFFANIAEQLGCKAVWWDALSIPSESKARSKALNMMHGNYANARYTVVHDKTLLNFPWSDDGSPCLALVLSTWFSRGWTALELSMSKTVKVLFKNPEEGPPVIKDLDNDILAQGPGSTSRAHWLATTLVKRLRQPVDDVGDLLAILTSRSTSWVRDRTIIAALLAGVPDCDFNLGESLITTRVLQYLGKIPYFCLLHGKPTMRNKGPYSWCAATLDDMPVDTSADLGGNRSGDLLEIDESGAVDGHWYCHTIDRSMVKRLKAYGNDLAAVVKVNVALTHWENCLLLHPSADRDEPLSLLAIPVRIDGEDGVLECRYIGTVLEERPGHGEEFEPESPKLLKVRLGANELPEQEGMPAHDAISKMTGTSNPVVNDPDDSAPERNGSSERQLILAPPDPPKWLELGKPLDDYRSHGVSLPELVTKMNHEDLLTAIRMENEDAALYLVKHDVNLGAINQLEIFRKLGDGEEACARMKMLGDVYAKAGKLQEAISIYTFVDRAYAAYLQTNGAFKNPLHRLRAKYGLGTVFVRAAREWGDKDLRERFRVSAADYINQAGEIFEAILLECQRRAEAHGDTEASSKEREKIDETRSHGLWKESPLLGDLSQGPPSQMFGTFNSGLNGPSLTIKHPSESQKVEKEERARDDQGWYRLELDVIADLTILLTGKEDLDGATKTFQRALRRFGCLPHASVEGLSVQFPKRDRFSFGEKNDRDEQAAGVYQRALKRFDTMFHGDHPLILLASLHLGVNNLLRSRFSSAETHLMRALNGFVSRLCPSSSGDPTPAIWRKDCDDEHIIIGLTRYHLGVLFKNQDKLSDAKEQLQKAKKIASRFRGLEGATLKLSATHELGILFSQMLQREGKREEIFAQAKECFEDVARDARDWLDAPRTDQPRFMSGISRLNFTSFSNQVLLYLHHGEPSLEDIKILEANLVKYCENKGDGAESTNGARKASDVAECEARQILGQVHKRQRDFQSAKDQLGMALEGYKYLYGECHLPTLEATVMYADTLIQLHEQEEAQREEAEKLLEKAVKNYDQTVGSYHPETLLACLKLGQVYSYRHKLAEAEKSCERAYLGFDKTRGSGHLMTARAALLLGSVYFAKGTLGKAQEVFGKAFVAFSELSNKPVEPEVGNAKQVDEAKPTADASKSTAGERKPDTSTTADESDPAPVTDIETLQAAMEYAKVSALIRTTITRDKAMSLYKLAIKGFTALYDATKSVTSLKSILVACMRLGALHGEMRQFKEGRAFIEKALSGFQKLLDQSRKPQDTSSSQSKAIQDSFEENFLEAQLKLAQLKLYEYKGEKKQNLLRTNIDIKAVKSMIQDTHKRLFELLGETHMLTLEAYTALGDLFLDGLGGRKNSPAEGEKILLDVLKHYGPDGKAKLALGHPTKVRIMDSLISYYDRIKLQKEVNKLNTQLWEELVEAHGADQAVLIIDTTSGPRNTARNINYDKARFRRSWRMSGAYSATSSSRADSSAIAEFLDFSTSPILSTMSFLPGFERAMTLVVSAGDLISSTTDKVTTTAGDLVKDTADVIVMGAQGLMKGTGDIMANAGELLTDTGHKVKDTSDHLEDTKTLKTGVDNMVTDVLSSAKSSLISRGIGLRTLKSMGGARGVEVAVTEVPEIEIPVTEVPVPEEKSKKSSALFNLGGKVKETGGLWGSGWHKGA